MATVTERRLQVVQKILALRPVYEIYNEYGGLMARVRQTWASVLRSTLELKDPDDQLIMTAKGGYFSLTFRLIRDGATVGTISRPLICFRPTFTLRFAGRTATGTGKLFFTRHFEVYDTEGRLVFRIDRPVVRLRDRYTVTIPEDIEWDFAALAVAVLDKMFY